MRTFYRAVYQADREQLVSERRDAWQGVTGSPV